MCRKLFLLISLVLVLALVGTNVALGDVIEVRIAASDDDVEEHFLEGGTMDITSSDLEITEEGSPDDNQLIGMRFNNIDIPQGAIINNAYVQFHVDETDVDGDNRPGTKSLRGEAVDNAATFSDTAFDVSSRPTTSAEASWDWPFWLTEHEEGPDQRTSDIAAVIQEIVDRPGWSPGNSLVLIITGSGENAAESFDGEADAAPLLHIEFGAAPAALPDGWQSQDIGTTGGSVAESDGTWAISADGADIWGSADEFHYAYVPLSGDGTIIAQVISNGEGSNGWAKGGVMIRETLDQDSKHALMALTGGEGGGMGFQNRQETGGNSFSSHGDPTAAPPYWVKLTRVGNTITGYSSADGVEWVQQPDGTGGDMTTNPVDIEMAEDVLIGLFATSHAAGEIRTYTFDNVSIELPRAMDNWEAAVAPAAPGFLATNIADGLYDIGAFSGDITYEFCVLSNPDETEASMCLIGRRQFGDTQAGLKFDQWNDTGEYGATVFGVVDLYYGIANNPGVDTHLVFVSSEDAATTALYVNGVYQGSVDSAITLFGLVGIGYGAEGEDATGSFDDFDGDIFGVAIYDTALSDEQIAAHSDAFFAPPDVTAPGDIVKGVPDDGLMDGDNFGWPGAETPDLAIDDNTGTKFLHFKGELEPTGFQVTPSAGPTIVTGLTLTTANDAIERDPISFELSGSNESIDGPYELIASGDIVDFAQADAWPRFTKNATPILFDNDVAYAHYQVLFPAVRDAGSANSMQIAEVELLGVPSPLVAHWTLDDGEGTIAVDSSGYGLDGILMGDPQWAAGIIGGALDFDGVDDYVDCGTSEALNNLSDAMTVSAWVNIRSVTTTWMGIVMKGETAWRLGVNGDTTGIHWGFTGGDRGWQAANSVTELPLDEWHHIAGTYDKSVGATVYVDGVAETVNPDPDGVRTNEMPLLLGENPEALGRLFDGILDDVRIYDRALSAEEISQLSGNILANGGFENGVVEPWSTYGDATAEVVQELVGAAVPDAPIEGGSALHVVVGSAGANFWDSGLQHAGHVFEAGKQYTLSAFLKCSQGTLDINFKPEIGEDPWTGYGSQAFTMTEEWTEFSVTTPVFDADVSPATITFHIGYAAADFWIDGVRFVEVQ